MQTTKRGFSLLELLVVVTLIAMVAAMVSVRLGSLAAKARLQLAIDQLRYCDTQSRSSAQRQGKAVYVEFDASKRRVTRSEVGSDELLSAPQALPAGVALSRMVRESSAASNRPVVFSPLGRSESYALRLTAQQDRLVRWLLIAGGTGQATVLEEDDAAARILATW